MKFQVTLTVSSLGKKIQAYFKSLEGTQFNCNSNMPTLVRVVHKDGWNGHKQGDVGTLCLKHVRKAFGRQVNATVVAVQWTDGEVDWGFHMQEKLEVLDRSKAQELAKRTE